MNSICKNCSKRMCATNGLVGKIVMCLFIGAIASLHKGVSATCYFAPELQGTFITQSTVTHDNEVLYSQVNITEDSIPIWGQCYKRIDSNVILKIDSDETSCYRCFRLKLVTRNVLRVHTADKDYISKCYTNEIKAIASCPTTDILKDRNRHKEIMLFKLLEYNGNEIRREYCPISGRYRFSYSIDDGMAEPIECAGKDSDMDNCPSGSAINLRFRQCTFEDHEMTFECLGHWQGLGQQKYVALVNTRMREKFGPQYRCAIYVENPNNGIITLSFSGDSTCSSISTYGQTNHAVSFTERNEILTLYPIEENPWHQQHQYCNLPEWMYGHWEYVTINAKEIVYRDHSSFKTYSMKCIENDKNTAIESVIASSSSSLSSSSPLRMHQLEQTHEAKFIAFSRTQCGEEQYHCVWINKRSVNILEFQIGSKTVQHTPDYSADIENICNDQYFDKTRWLTQGRLDNGFTTSPCPVDGEFFGLIPDAEGLCAKLWSECATPDVMFYQVSACDYDEVFEEREYQCLGQWMENDVVYTYTKRRDVGTYECFVGALSTNQEIFIKEAGEHCQRDVDPYRYGMQLNQTKSCGTNKKIYQNQLPFDGNGNHRSISLPIDRQTNQSDRINSYQQGNKTSIVVPAMIPSDVGLTTTTTKTLDIFAKNRPRNKNSSTDSVAVSATGIGYDDFHNVNVIDQYNETIQIVNINRAKQNESNLIDGSSSGDESYYTSTKHPSHFDGRTTNRKMSKPTKKQSKDENETFEYSGTARRILLDNTIFITSLVALAMFAFIKSNLCYP